MKYGLIGEKLGHSFSKIIHNMIADYDYEICEIAPDDFDAFMEKRDFNAINVTIPYKKRIIPFLDYISDEAKEIGAVNVVVNKDGKLSGYNTDLGGLIALIKRTGAELSGKKVLIAGTGGTSNTAMTAAKMLSASEVIKLSRSSNPGVCTYDEAYELHSDAKFIINTTPSGMYPELMDKRPFDVDKFPELEGIVDAVYNPLRTQLVCDAKNKGIISEGGLYMLVMQAVLASEIFIGTKYDKKISDKVFETIYNSKQNIVLIGMPGSGKTTVGTMLAKELSRPLIDTDEEIVKKMQMPITDIFTKYGEDGFRDIEAEVVEEVSKLNGVIIATGGGAILRPENVRNLKLNGRVYFLDRPLQDLVPTDTRPLSSSYEALKKRFDERYDKYLAATDVRVCDCKTPKATVDFIKGDID